MMGVSLDEARNIAWWEYQALIWNWNDRHKADGQGEEVEAPDAEFVAAQFERLAARGMVTGSVH